MHLALLVLEFRCHSRIARRSDYRGKPQKITMQKFHSLTISIRWRECRIIGGTINGS